MSDGDYEDVEARLREQAEVPDAILEGGEITPGAAADALADMRRQRDEALAERDTALALVTGARAEVMKITRERDLWMRRTRRAKKIAYNPTRLMEVEQLVRERDEWHQRAVDEYNLASACVADEVALDKVEAQLTEARAEVERLTRERDDERVMVAASGELVVEWRNEAERLTRERDEARAELTAPGRAHYDECARLDIAEAEIERIRRALAEQEGGR